MLVVAERERERERASESKEGGKGGGQTHSEKDWQGTHPTAELGVKHSEDATCCTHLDVFVASLDHPCRDVLESSDTGELGNTHHALEPVHANVLAHLAHLINRGLHASFVCTTDPFEACSANIVFDLITGALSKMPAGKFEEVEV
jgi:hypothetical protein